MYSKVLICKFFKQVGDSRWKMFHKEEDGSPYCRHSVDSLEDAF